MKLELPLPRFDSIRLSDDLGYATYLFVIVSIVLLILFVLSTGVYLVGSTFDKF